MTSASLPRVLFQKYYSCNMIFHHYIYLAINYIVLEIAHHKEEFLKITISNSNVVITRRLELDDVNTYRHLIRMFSQYNTKYSNIYDFRYCFQLDKMHRRGRAWWLMPVIPALWEAQVGGSRSHEFKTSLANMVKPCI